MKERPILFSAPMVRALLDGSKTQTRRIMKNQPRETDADPIRARLIDVICKSFERKQESHLFPYGIGGDRLWVREAWRIGAWDEDEGEVAIDYLADGFSRREWIQVPEKSDFERYWMQCTDDAAKAGLETDAGGKYHWAPGNSPCRGRPSIHMPRWASRILLEITSVRVERLHDISEADATAEGTPHSLNHPAGRTATENYQYLWECINGDGSWDLNPWVWVIEFKRVMA